MKLIATEAASVPTRADYQRIIRQYACARCGRRFAEAASFVRHPVGYPVFGSSRRYAIFARCACEDGVGFGNMGKPGFTIPLDQEFWERELRGIWRRSLASALERETAYPPRWLEDLKRRIFAVSESFLGTKRGPLDPIDELNIALLGNFLSGIRVKSIPESLASLRRFKHAFAEWEKSKGVPRR